MHCNECEALVINGLLCHETGCPNTRKPVMSCKTCVYTSGSATCADCDDYSNWESHIETPTESLSLGSLDDSD